MILRLGQVRLGQGLAKENYDFNFSKVNVQNQPEISRYNCLSQMFSNNFISPNWTINYDEDYTKVGKKIQISFDDSRGN